MGKTYRRVPTKFFVRQLQNKRIKQKDNKHQTLIIWDGLYNKPIDQKQLDAKAKRVLKRLRSKRSRRYSLSNQ